MFISSSSFCQNSPCILHLQSYNLEQINASLVQMNFQGRTHQLCIFGGAYFGEIVENKLTEFYHFCENYVRHIPERSIYSQNSSLIIAFHWFPHSSYVSAILSVSTTRCKTIKLSLINLQCACRPLYRIPTTCQSYLTEISRFSPATLRSTSSVYDRTTKFCMPRTSCIVVQTTCGKPLCLFVAYRRILSLIPWKNCQFPSKIHYEIFVRMKPVFPASLAGRNMSWLFQESLNKGAKDAFTFRGMAAEMCTFHFKQNSSVCLSNVGSAHQIMTEENFFTMMQEHFHEQMLYTTVVVKTPMTKDAFHLEIDLLSVVDSWFDIILSAEEDDTILNNFMKPIFQENFDGVFLESGIPSIGSAEIIMKLVEPQHNGSCEARFLLKSRFEPEQELTSKDEDRLLFVEFISQGLFTSHAPSRIISLSGTVVRLQVWGDENQCCSLDIHWMKIVHHVFGSLVRHRQEKCQIDQQTNLMFECHSFWVEDSLLKRNYLIFYRTCSSPEKLHSFSWIEAASICRNYSKSLPHFSSRQELDQMLAAIKLSPVALPIEGLFIDLIALRFVTNTETRELFSFSVDQQWVGCGKNTFPHEEGGLHQISFASLSSGQYIFTLPINLVRAVKHDRGVFI